MEWNSCAYLTIAFVLTIVYARYVVLRRENEEWRKTRQQFWEDFEHDLDEWAKNQTPDEPAS